MPIGAATIAALGVSGGLGLLQSGIGIADMIKGRKTLKKAQSFYEKNKYEIPEAARSSLGVAERQASSLKMPGEDIARARLAESTAAGVGSAQQAATSASDVLSVLSGLYGQQMSGEQDILMAGAERYDRNQAQLMNALNTMAGFEREKWQYNVLYPYQQMLGQAEAYSTRGRQELSAGLGSLGQTAGSFANISSQQRMFDDYLARMLPPQNQ